MGCCQPKPQKNDASAIKQAESNNATGDSCSPVARSKSTMYLFMTNKERVAILSSDSISPSTKLLLCPPFANFSAFNSHLYLTGLAGITLDNLKQHHIKCLVNVAEEIPPLVFDSQQPSLLYFKYSINDSYGFQISNFLNTASDQINKVIKEKDGNVVVFCSAGMSRSCTIVLAYAIKYHKMSLKEAFHRIQEVRPYARPNLAFFQQLVQFEHDCLGTNSVEMMSVSMAFEYDDKKQDSEKVNNKKKKKPTLPEQYISAPDFYRKEFPHLLKLEISDAMNGNCPLVSSESKVAGQMAKSSASKARSCQSKAVQAKKSGKKVTPKATSKVSAIQPDQAYVSNELKPFVVDGIIQYESFVEELNKARANKRDKSKQRLVSPARTPKSSKK